MRVTRFGEKGDDKWYETMDNKRIQCGENVINTLWEQWICKQSNIERQDDEDYSIFAVTNGDYINFLI